MRLQILRIFVVAMFAGLMASSADAQTATPQTVKSMTGQLGASINNAGLQQSFDLAWRRDIGAFGGVVAATPAGFRVGSWLEFTPARFFTVRTGTEATQYFGTFQSISSFDGRTAAFDPDARKALNNAGPGRAQRYYVTPSLQARAGHFAGRSSFSLERWNSSADGPYFYEPTRDTLLAVKSDDLSILSTTVVYQKSLNGGGQLSFGPTHSLMRVSGTRVNQVQKLGLVAIHQAAGQHLGFKRPNIAVQASYYIDDPNKKGQWSAALAVGFSLGKR